MSNITFITVPENFFYSSPVFEALTDKYNVELDVVAEHLFQGEWELEVEVEGANTQAFIVEFNELDI